MVEFEEQAKQGYINLTRILEAGKYGTVYEGLIPADNHYGLEQKAIAIKVSKNNDPKTFEQFQNEIEWFSTLQHPNIIKGRRLARGGDLNARLRALNWQQTLNIIKRLAGVIYYLHSLNVRHGDLKTPNILLSEDLQPKLGDLGTVMCLNHDAQHHVANDRPENIFTHGFADPWSFVRGHKELSDDVYSFGVIMLQLLSKAEFEEIKQDLVGKVEKEIEDGKIVVHERLRVTGCSKTDATHVTRLALDLVGGKPTIKIDDPSSLLRIPIEQVIQRLEQVQVCPRSYFKRNYLKFKFKVKKIKTKFSKM